MNYGKSFGPKYHEISHLIDKIANTSSAEQFNKCTKDHLRIVLGTPSPITLVNDEVKTKYSFVGCIIDQKPKSLLLERVNLS